MRGVKWAWAAQPSQSGPHGKGTRSAARPPPCPNPPALATTSAGVTCCPAPPGQQDRRTLHDDVGLGQPEDPTAAGGRHRQHW